MKNETAPTVRVVISPGMFQPREALGVGESTSKTYWLEISAFIFCLKSVIINGNGISCAGGQLDNHWLSLLGINGRKKHFQTSCQKTEEHLCDQVKHCAASW